MFVQRCKTWLGFGRSETVVGLHLGPEYASIVAMRSHPLEIRAIGRQIVFDGAAAADEHRLIEFLSTDLTYMVDELRLAPATRTVATIEPLADTITLIDGATQLPIGVHQRTHDRLVTVVGNAGLELTRLDLVPIALARLGRLGHGATVAIRSPSRWTIVASEGFTEAERSASAAVPTLSIGSDLGSTQPFESLPGIVVPTLLADDLDPARDAPAIGAALAHFAHPPMVAIQPRRPEPAQTTAASTL